MKTHLIGALAAAALAGCGGSNSSVTINLTTTGVVATNANVRYGYDLLYVNKDTAPHSIGSQACPDLAVLNVQPNATATVNVGNVLYVNKSCDLYDPQNPGYGSATIKIIGAG